MAKKKLSVLDLHKMKRADEKIAWLTAYDFPTAQFAEAAGLDMLLVGDSLGMCVYGYHGTVPVTMDQCIVHCEAVRRGAPNTFVIGDMPFMSYQTSDIDAVRAAGRFLKEADVDEKMLSVKYIEALEKMAEGDNKVFVPFEATGLMGSIATVKELLNKSK